MGAIERGSEVAERLVSTPVAWLTTVRADGQPQSSYIWFHFDGDDLLVFSEPTTGKVRNVRANPKVSFHLDGDGRGGQVLTIDAEAEILTGDVIDTDRVRAYLAKYDQAIRTQLHSTPEQIHAQFNTALRIIPSRVRSW
jgi:PPOX class probable F420-dependent enzyme